MRAAESPQRVLRVITRLNVGGPTRHVRILMEGLDAARFAQTLVVGRAEPGEGAGLLEVAGDRRDLSCLRRPAAPRQDWLAFRALSRLMCELQPSLVHTHQGKAGVLARLAARRRWDMRLVHTYHGHTFKGYFAGGVARAFRALERHAAARSDALICQSPSQAEDVLQAMGRHAEGRVVIIPPALPAELFARQPQPERSASLRAELGASQGDAVLLFPARLVPIKRPELALRAAAQVARQRPIQLWMAGDGPLRAESEALADQLGLAGKVRWLGHRTDLWDLMEAADLSFLTSRMEGTPLALLEAAALGCPLVAPAVGGVRDVLGEAAPTLDAEAPPEAWAEVIQQTLERGADPSVSARQADVRKAQDPRLLVARMTDLYERLLAGPSRS